jgi:hypothetical protein
MNNVATPTRSSQQHRTVWATNSGLLSLRRNCGVPRTVNKYCRIPITSWAGQERSTSIARHSRVYSSITAKGFSCRPSSVRSVRKSYDQTWFMRSALRRMQLF